MTDTTAAAVPDRVDAYASALFEVARAEGALERVQDELFRLARAFESNDELRATLTDQRIPPERRQGIVEDLLGQRASPVSASLVSFVIAAGRARDLPAIVDRLLARAASERQAVVAQVRSSVELDDDQRRRLAQALADATGRNVDVHVVVDPSVIGGVVAQVGDTVIDGTVRHRLEQLRASLAGNRGTAHG